MPRDKIEPKAYKNSRTGYRGVMHAHNTIQPFRAAVSREGVYYHLGYFGTAEEAYEAYLAEVARIGYVPGGRKKRVIIDGQQECYACKEWLPLEKFNHESCTASGYKGRCRLCTSKYRNKQTSESIGRYIRDLVRHSVRRSSKKSGAARDNDLTEGVVLGLWAAQGGRCAVTGVAMTHERGQGRVQTNMSVDRIDSSLGYTVANVRLVCSIVNIMKLDLRDSDFLEWCRLVVAGGVCGH